MKDSQEIVIDDITKDFFTNENYLAIINTIIYNKSNNIIKISFINKVTFKIELGLSFQQVVVDNKVPFYLYLFYLPLNNQNYHIYDLSFFCLYMI